MEPTERSCPACGSREYAFRGRKKIAAEGQPEQWETKYRCSTCQKEWKDRMPVNRGPEVEKQVSHRHRRPVLEGL
jgi:DNA-directed RNA polymerase subunit RPC12/RpoP